MSDLIDRQAAIMTAVKAAIDWHRLANQQYSIAYCIGEAMRELPSAQPEIIRCKDCKHCEHWYADKGRCFLWHEGGIDVFEEGFCNYAERRADG